MASQPGPPPPPPPPGYRGPPGAPIQVVRPGGGGGPPPPPPGGQRGPAPPPPGPPQGAPMQMPIRQQSSYIKDITPPKRMDDAACLKKLTTYCAFTIRKVPPHNPKKETGTWARAEVVEERMDQEVILKQVRKLNEKSRSVADKKRALATFQQGQITNLVDDLASKERDRAFEWSLVQLDTVKKPVSALRGGKRKEMYETVSMTAYVKRAPYKDLNPIMLLQNIEKQKAESMRPPPPPQQQGREPEPIRIFPDDKKGKGRSKSREKKNHDHGDSSTDSYTDSDTDTHSSYSDSLDTSISSKSREHRRRSHPRAFRNHNRHREPKFFIEHRAHSPEHHFDAYGGPPRPYVPDVPRAIPTLAVLPQVDPVHAAYLAGRGDADAERYGTSDRIAPRPVERIIERVVDRPVPVITYGPRLQERYPPEPRYTEEVYYDDLRPEYRRREAHAEEYINERLDGVIEDRLDGGRRRAEPGVQYIDRRGSDYYRRPSEPLLFHNSHPFSPRPLRRQYDRDSVSTGVSGW